MLDAILAVLLAVVAIVGVGGSIWSYRKGKSDAETKQEIEEHNRRTATRQRIDEVNLGDDPGVLRDWLRNRDPNKR